MGEDQGLSDLALGVGCRGRDVLDPLSVLAKRVGLFEGHRRVFLASGGE